MVNTVHSDASQLLPLTRTRADHIGNLQPVAAYASEDSSRTDDVIDGNVAQNPNKVSDQAYATFLKLQEGSGRPAVAAGTEPPSGFITVANGQHINLDAYFSNDRPEPGPLDIELGAHNLILPSGANVQALQEHVSARFKEMLAAYDIPEAPAEITYGDSGEIQLPADYPYTDELMQALEENPGIAHELSSLNGIASHYVELQKLTPYLEEVSAATSKAAVDAIIAKYSYLFGDSRSNSHIALTFSDTNDLELTADSAPVEFA